jgi:hypothetical protein
MSKKAASTTLAEISKRWQSLGVTGQAHWKEISKKEFEARQAAAISGKEQQAAAPDEGWKFVRSAFGVALRNSIINTFSRQIRKFSQTPHIQVRVHCRRITHMYIKTKIKFHLLATILEGRAS